MQLLLFRLTPLAHPFNAIRFLRLTLVLWSGARRCGYLVQSVCETRFDTFLGSDLVPLLQEALNRILDLGHLLQVSLLCQGCLTLEKSHCLPMRDALLALWGYESLIWEN